MREVFRFSFVQQLKSKYFSIVSIVIAVVLFILAIAIMALVEVFDKEDVKSEVDYIYVSDSSILSGLDYNLIHTGKNELFSDITFINYSGTPQEAVEAAAQKSENALAMEVKDSEDGGFTVNIFKTQKYENEDKLDEYISHNLKYVIYEKAGLTSAQKNEILRQTTTVTYVVGDEKSAGDIEFFKTMIPGIFSMILYMMILLYGQNISRSVVLEKDSKIIENILTFANPYDIIFGKLFSQWLLAIMQFTLWIVSIILGITAGVFVSGMISNDGHSSGEKFLDFMATVSESGAFSPAFIVIAIISLMFGFLLYCSLAAFVGSFASKTEEVNNYYGIYTMITVVCWMMPYTLSLNGDDHLMGIMRIIPFTGAFTVPADLILGKMTMSSALLSTVIMIACSALIVFLAAKVYKAFVLYKGNTLKLKDIINILKNSKAKDKV
ncbi:MAG: ABC transporter permease [Oscillospiraceae bacterium]|nr:ABC transporter permease [Oscillospiraceae bacterium]